MLSLIRVKALVLLAAAGTLATPAAFAQTVLYVDRDAPGANDGSSWVDAFTDLQDALLEARTNGLIEQTRVAAGAYTSDRGSGDRDATFRLLDGVAVMGGYAGYGEPDPDLRDIAAHETILSGDLEGNDGFGYNKWDNSYHVVTGSGANATAVLDGFTVIGGYSYNHSGGGMYNECGSPTVKSCRFVGNEAECGGGMYNENSSPTVVNCAFSGNAATALWVFFGGGGMYNFRSDPVVTNCTFSNNQAELGSGGMYNHYSDPVLSNCVFWENVSDDYEMTVEEQQIYDRNGAPNVSHCCIEGWSGTWGGIGNFGDNPQLVDADGPDGYVGTLDDDLHLAPGSPCINAGDDDAISLDDHDFDGHARRRHCRVDIGADETDFFHNDCNGNTVADACDLIAGTSDDCNDNDVPDECEPEEDCNTNGIADICDVAAGTSQDWNTNGILDVCDIAAGTSADLDGDGVPDECVLYVDLDAPGADDGSSWENAYTDLRTAISAGCGSGVIAQVRVAAGTYKPAYDGNRLARFELCNQLAIMGGYAGFGEPDPDARDFVAYETVLSGDLNDDDQGAANREDNSYHVVSNVEYTGYSVDAYTYMYLDASAVLDGFTVSGGNMATSEWEPSTYWRAGGGGMQLGHGSPTIRNCTFWNNTAEWDGGGLCNYYGRPTLVNCAFIENRAAHDGGGIGNHGGHVTLIDCLFVGNSADNDGGGLFSDDYWDEASVTLIGCTFIDNNADPAYGFGGGVWSGGDTTATNCVFGANAASGGGGMYSSWGSADLVNCTLSGNWAVHDGAGFFSFGLSSVAKLTNCILWDNENTAGTTGEEDQLAAWSGQLAADYCCIQGLEHFSTNGTGNIADDPQFVDADGSDDIPGTEDDDLRLLADSPCIDAGSNGAVPLGVTTDLEGNLRIVDGDDDGEPVVDMGAYEFQPEAACSYIYDLNGSCFVDAADLGLFAACWLLSEGETGWNESTCADKDFDCSGTVDAIDLGLFAGAWLKWDNEIDPADYPECRACEGEIICIPEGMVLVPAGEFEMGDPWSEGGSNERPVHTVYLSPYHIDTCEVTNQQYCDALNWAYAQGGLITVTSGVVYKYNSGTSYPYCDTYSHDADSRIHWDGSTFTVTAGKEDHPMLEVSWYGSVAFSNWRGAMEGRPLCYDLETWACDFDVAGYRLPTEAEWEKAAGWDPVQYRHFRFGEHTDGCGYNCLDGQRANYWSSGDPFETGDYP